MHMLRAEVTDLMFKIQAVFLLTYILSSWRWEGPNNQFLFSYSFKISLVLVGWMDKLEAKGCCDTDTRFFRDI